MTVLTDRSIWYRYQSERSVDRLAAVRRALQGSHGTLLSVSVGAYLSFPPVDCDYLLTWRADLVRNGLGEKRTKRMFISKNGCLARDTAVIAWGRPVTIPAGTRLRTIETGLGPEWAVADIALVIRLTGNTHDPVYRWLVVPSDTEVTS